MPTIYEYRTVRTPPEPGDERPMDERLNEVAKHGFRLVGAVSAVAWGYVIMEREWGDEPPVAPIHPQSTIHRA